MGGGRSHRETAGAAQASEPLPYGCRSAGSRSGGTTGSVLLGAACTRRGPALEPLVAGAALTAGWALRLHHLGWQSFWYDEGTSITVAPRDLSTILASAAADIHPPLYYLLLHGWVGLTRPSEYAAPLPSAPPGPPPSPSPLPPAPA